MTDEPLRASATLIDQAQEARRAVCEAVERAEALGRRIAEWPDEGTWGGWPAALQSADDGVRQPSGWPGDALHSVGRPPDSA